MSRKYEKRTLTMHSREVYNAVIPTNELLGSMKDLSTGAFKLLMYYYSKKTGWIYDDIEIAKAIDVTERRVRELRKELIDKRYLLVVKGTVDLYFVGRKAVTDWEEGAINESENNE